MRRGQPDVCVVGGIGEWLAVADTARASDIQGAPYWSANVQRRFLRPQTPGVALAFDAEARALPRLISRKVATSNLKRQ